MLFSQIKFAANNMSKLITKTILPYGNHHTATVIFFHGSGDTGNNLIEWIRILLGRDMLHNGIKFIFPTAPIQPYTPLNGEPSNVWFDRDAISIEAKENIKSLKTIYETVNQLIQDEIDNGIPLKKIIVGGFSMGGALALHTGYHLNHNLGGIFALSSFLNRDSIVYDTLKNLSDDKKLNLPEILMFHGDRDTLVPSKWGQETFNQLQNFGVNGEFILLKNTLHELKKKEMITLEEWILKIIGNNDNNVLNKL